MICLLKNSCTDSYLCCYYCSNTKCDKRCKDDFKKCKWFDNVKEYKIPEGSNVILPEPKKCKNTQKKNYSKRKLI